MHVLDVEVVSCLCTGVSFTTMADHMLVEGVEVLCQCLSMTKIDSEEILMKHNLVDDVVARGKNCLLTKLQTEKHYNREAFKVTMRRAWRTTKTTCFHEMGDGLMLVEFEGPNGKARVM